MNMKCPSREDIVSEFHRKFNHPIDTKWTSDLLELRMNLIKEETKEVSDEIIHMVVDLERGKSVTLDQKAKLLKELCDLQYVLSGTAVALGLDVQTAFNRVHASNLSKLGYDGKPIYREDGKVVKGPNYKLPNLEDLVR